MTLDAGANVDVLCRELIREILWRGARVPPGSRTAAVLSPLIRKPLRRFSEIACEFDERVAADGFRQALDWFLPHFVSGVTVHGDEHVPRSGPLLIASNHPGTCDALAIASAIPRDNVRILAARIPFLDNLPATREHLLFTSPDQRERNSAIWAAIRRLNAGGCVLMFPSGGLDPDPSCMPGLEPELDTWAPTVPVILRRARDTRLVPAIVSGVLLPRYVRHVLTRFPRKRRDRQRVAEYVQVIRQILSRRTLLVHPRVTFGRPVTLTELRATGVADTGEAIARQARRVLSSHLAAMPAPRSG